MEQTEVTILQVGGDAVKGLTTSMATPIDEERIKRLQAFIEEGAKFDIDNIGLPISYTVRYLSDSTLVTMNNSFEYTVEEKYHWMDKYNLKIKILKEQSGN